MRFINSERLRNYPKFVLISILIVIGINLVTRDGWQGGFGQIIGSDFITLYGAGILYKGEIEALYEFNAQFNIQKELISPTHLSGLNPFISPPYVAFLYSVFTTLSLPLSFALTVLSTVVFIAIAIRGMRKLMPAWLHEAGLDQKRMLILVMSFFPSVLGLLVGQNHGFTLLLMTGIVIFTLSGRWGLAGLLAGALIYKPHFIVGFLILWLVWKEYTALIAFGAVTTIVIGATILQYGITPYADYFSISSVILRLPLSEGFPGSLLVTPYGLISTLLPSGANSAIQVLMISLSLVMSIGLAWIGFRFRSRPFDQRTPPLIIGLLFPLVATPYVLVHDLIILVPAFILWSCVSKHRNILYVAVFTYFAGLILPILGQLAQIALVATIPIVFILVYTVTNLNSCNNHKKICA